MQIERNIVSMKVKEKPLLAQLETLRSLMQAQYTQLDHLRSLFPPVRCASQWGIDRDIQNLPVCIRDRWKYRFFVQPKLTLCLSQVCQYCRHIAIDTEQLWSPIYISLKNTSPGQFATLKLFLERSGTGLLDISIVRLSNPYPDDWDRFSDQLELLPAISRWRHTYVFGKMRYGI